LNLLQYFLDLVEFGMNPLDTLEQLPYDFRAGPAVNQPVRSQPDTQAK
jgi:hypothetical protein